MYPYNADGIPVNTDNKNTNNDDFNSSIAYTNGGITTVIDDASFHRHDLSFRQWMIYNYESLYNDISDNGSFKRDYIDEDGNLTDDAPKGTAIFTITDAYIKNLQDRRISNCGDLDGKITIDSNTIVEKWAGYNDYNGE